MKFTLPVVMSIKTIGGVCRSGIGTFVVINDEGWIVTAAHIIKQISDIATAEAKTRALESGASVTGGGGGTNRHARRAAKKGGPQSADIDRWSIFWGMPSAELDGSVTIIEPADLAIGKLKNFDKTLIQAYPVFKDPSKNFDPGTSLCRLGFPFYDVGPVYSAATGFSLTNFPLPIFPNEGILSRMQEIVLIDPAGQPLPPPPFPIKMIETSSAGIRGQSGGPIFDTKGAIWGIQSSTASYEMDLNTKEKQYYHVGVGVHAETILGALKGLNINFQMSAH
jgi:hypothetical protein